jgi:hypothetical protein
MDKTFFSRINQNLLVLNIPPVSGGITIFLIAIVLLFFVSGIGAKEIDANVWRIDNNSVWSSMPSYSYATDGNLTIDFNVASDTNFGYHYADINYSLTNLQGSGTPIITGLIVDGNRCQTNFIGTWDNTANSDVNLVAYYKFDAQEDVNTIQAFDYSGKGNHGQYLSGADNNASGKWDTNALFLDGINDYVNLGSNENIQARLGNPVQLTVCAWIYLNSMTDDDQIMGRCESGVTNGWLLFRDDVSSLSGRLDVYTMYVEDGNGGASAVRVESAAYPTLNKWTHICGTFIRSSATGLRLYINGVEDSNSPKSVATIDNIQGGVSPFYIGTRQDGTVPFNGFIEEVKVWDRALTAAEISLDYNLSTRNFRSCKWDWNIMTVSDANYYASVLVRDNAGNSDFNASYNNFRVNPSGAPTTCNCPVSGNWILNDSSQCILNSVCDIGANKLIIINGSMTIQSTGWLKTTASPKIIFYPNTLLIYSGAKIG